MNRFLTPTRFLVVGGAALLALSILGFISDGLLKENGLFSLSNGEVVARSILGSLALVAAWGLKERKVFLTRLVVLVGIVALFFGVYGFIHGDTLRWCYAPWASPSPCATIPSPGLAMFGISLGNGLHLVVGVWALTSAFMKGPAIPYRSGAVGQPGYPQQS